MRAILISMLLGLVVVAEAAVYKIVNPDGTVTFSDRPEEGAEQIDVGPVQTLDAPAAPAGVSAPVQAPAFSGYEVFEVTRPENDETFRDNGGLVEVRLTLQPDLFREHTINVFMDGKDIGAGRSTSITLQNVDRGSHRIHATVLDKDGEQVASTAPVTFHLHRTSVLNSP